jgi:tetratricopeptide (TPR) repeat protein
VVDRSILWANLIGIGATIAIVQPASIAATAPEIAKTAKAITVQITEPGSQGSGVILQRQGDVYTVLTAAHVVKNRSASFTIATSDGKKYPLLGDSIRLATADLDLAVFKFRASDTYPIAKLGNCNLLSEGMDLYVGGYPLATEAINKSVFVFRTGTVSANSTQTLDKGYSLIYSNDTLPGMSGGAVLNQNGELVAIHGRGDRERTATGEFGQKTGFNLGIPINRFATIADNLGVNLGQKVAAIPQAQAPKADDYFVLANQKYDKGDYRGAVTDYDRAIALKPDYAKAYKARATVKFGKLQDDKGALADLDRSIQLDPNDGLVYALRGFLKYDKLKDNPGAIADLDRSIQLDPNNGNAYTLRGGIKLQKLGDNQGALSDLNRAISLEPKSPEASLLRGILKYQRLNDSNGALADLNRAIALDPKNSNAYAVRGILKYQKLKNSRGALADFTRTIELDPQNTNAYLLRGLIYEELKDRPSAIKNIRQAAKLAQQQGDNETYKNANDVLKEWGIPDKS